MERCAKAKVYIPDMLNHSLNSQRKQQPTNPRASGRDTHHQTPLLLKPLTQYRYSRDEDEAQANAKEHALREVQMPDLRGERGGDETDCLDTDTNEHGDLRPCFRTIVVTRGEMMSERAN